MWLSLIAYTIRAGVWLGLVKTESDDPKQRAYIRWHQALNWLRTHLQNGRLQEHGEHFLQLEDGRRISFEAPFLKIYGVQAMEKLSPRFFVDPRQSTEFDLGEQGQVRFSYQLDVLTIDMQASDQGALWGQPFRLGLAALEPGDQKTISPERSLPHGNSPTDSS